MKKKIMPLMIGFLSLSLTVFVPMQTVDASYKLKKAHKKAGKKLSCQACHHKVKNAPAGVSKYSKKCSACHKGAKGRKKVHGSCKSCHSGKTAKNKMGQYLKAGSSCKNCHK